MKQSATILTLLVVVLTIGGCQQEQKTASSAPSQAQPGVQVATTMTPEELGTLGAQIRKDPDQADTLLSQRGLTRESFEKAIRDVTENADAAKRYSEAYRKASA
jgi:hypothetical protein